MKKAIMVISFFIFLDQITKFIIRKTLGPFEIIKVLPGLNIVHVSNTGAAFGILRDLGNHFFILISILAIFIIIYLFKKARSHVLAYSLILSGAIGNLIDRIFIGHVTDFIDLYIGRFHWPAFNVADSCLSIGIVLFGIKAIFYERKVHGKGN